jgi:hypothetical protein
MRIYAVLTASIVVLEQKTSYSIERKLMKYVPTALYGAVMVVSPVVGETQYYAVRRCL